MFKKLSIRGRLTLQFLLSVSVLFLFFGLSIYFFSDLYLEKRFFKRLQDRAVTTATLFFDFQATDDTILKIVDNTDKEYLVGEVVSIYETERNLFLFTTDITKEDFHREFLKKLDKKNNINYLTINGYRMAALRIPNQKQEYWVFVSALDKTSIEALRDLKNILLVLALVALLLIGLLGWYFAQKALGPITYIIDQLDEIFPKNLGKRVDHSNFEDEIGKLADTINKLLDRVESSIHTQKMFVANISHEIKNPLTKIFTQIELLEMKYKDNPELHEKLLSLRADSLKLNQLTQDILQLAHVISNDSKLPMEATRLDEVLWEAISDVKKWNPDYKIKAKMVGEGSEEEDFMLMANADALKVAFKNLIDNACKFSSDQSSEVILDFSDHKKRVYFNNNGEHIPKKEMENLFQPFYRVNATAKGKSGHGVGLAIVKQIINMHEGKISVSSTESGNSFELLFP
jgi:signal transduction histidine kinase